MNCLVTMIVYEELENQQCERKYTGFTKVTKHVIKYKIRETRIADKVG